MGRKAGSADARYPTEFPNVAISIIASAVLNLTVVFGVTAQNFVVTSVADMPDADPGDGICAAADGSCTLRAAVMQANVVPGPGSITLPAGSFVLAIQGVNEDNAALGDLDILGELTISGSGPLLTRVDAASLDRVFDVFPPGLVVIQDLAVTDGLGDGGGILNRGSLALRRVLIEKNRAYNWGGGIHNLGTYNAAPVTLSILESTVRGNRTIGSTAAAGGGGILNEGHLEITGSTVSGNMAGNGTQGRGGGIYNIDSTLTVINSTISGNSALNGGGLFNRYGTVDMHHVTVVGNSAHDEGGGLWNYSGSFTAPGGRLTNSIVANNLPTDLKGSFGTTAYNRIGDTSETLNGTGDLTGQIVLLGPLADNGGPTQTHEPLVGSPALNAIPAANCPQGDQRAEPRPQPPGGNCDVGAVEVQSLRLLVDCLVGSDASSGMTWTPGPNGALRTLQRALQIAEPGDEIWVAGRGDLCVYTPLAGILSTSTTARAESFMLEPGVAIYGGFDGEYDRHLRNWHAHPTILSGEIGDPGTATDNSLHVVNAGGADQNTVLDGFVIQHGFAQGTQDPLHFTNPNWGGGVYSEGSPVRLNNLVIRQNNADQQGGGLYTRGGNPRVSNSLVAENTAKAGSAWYMDSDGHPVVVNVTFMNNETVDQGSADIHYWAAFPTFTNSILWDAGDPVISMSQPNATFVCSLVSGSGGSGAWNPAIGTDGSPGTCQNIDVDPDLGVDFIPSPGSPAIDAGHDADLVADLDDLDGDLDVSEGIPFDLAKADRIQGQRVDMGAYEASESTEVCGIKFDDTDLDHEYDPGTDPPLAGWTIHLSQNMAVVATAVTDAQGAYCFEDVPPGQYLVFEEPQDGWIQCFPTTSGGVYQVTVSEGQSITGLHFGNGCGATEALVVNTGFDHVSGQVYGPPSTNDGTNSVSTQDAFWTIAANPEPGWTPPQPADVISPIPPFAPPTQWENWAPAQLSVPGSVPSSWIGGRTTLIPPLVGTGPGQLPYDFNFDTVGLYTYRFKFCVTDTVEALSFDLRVLADESATLHLSEAGVRFFDFAPPVAGFNTPTAVAQTVTWTFAPTADYALEVDVVNVAPRGWTGLNVVGTVSGPGVFFQDHVCCSGNGFITGSKFDDEDGDGTWDLATGEAGEGGVLITLTNLANGQQQTFWTNPDGSYAFEVPPGMYSVAETVPAGSYQTFPAFGVHAPVYVNAGQVVSNLDFGNAPATCQYVHLDVSGTQANPIYELTVENMGPGPAAGLTIFSLTPGVFVSPTFFGFSTPLSVGSSATVALTFAGGPSAEIAVVLRGPYDPSTDANDWCCRADTLAVSGLPNGTGIESSDVPERFELHQNYPNPFSGVTQIGYDLRESAHARLVVFDMMGRLVETLVDEVRAAGRYAVAFRANDLASGVYVVQFSAGDAVRSRRMVLTR